MKAGLTEIVKVVDRSGSMERVYSDTIGGLNTYVASQRKEPGECLLTVIQFDDKYEVLIVAQNIQHVREFSAGRDFIPRGSTALYDALGRAITETGARLSALDEAVRPERVLFVIVTDGFENASKEYTQPQVFDMIKHQQDKYKWDFTYIGANQDSMRVGATIGIKAGKTLDFSHTGGGTRGAFAAAANYSSSYRGAPTLEAATASSFTVEDRQAAKADDNSAP